MSTTLYFSLGTCAFVPHCLLEMSGADYEPIPVKLHRAENATDAYLAMNPRGQVPVLVQDGVVITQTIAICNYLSDRFPEQHFMPSDPLAKAKALESFLWMNNTVHPTFTRFFMPSKFADDATSQAAVKAASAVQYGKLLHEMQAMVAALSAQSPWLSGTHCGPVDAYALTLARWGGYASIDPTTMPVLWAHCQKIAQIPAVARVIERERLQLNVFKPVA